MSKSKSKTPPISKSSAGKTNKREKKSSRTKSSLAKSRTEGPDLGATASAQSHPFEDLSDLGEMLTVGYHPPKTLMPQDETLFRAFQSNLLSMISHELRTPLMGILNALAGLHDGSTGLPPEELVSMARRNAMRLQQTLSSLLDLASIESGMFHARLREVDLERMTEGRVQSQKFWLEESGVSIKKTGSTGSRKKDPAQPVLADPQKLGRAIDLSLQSIVPRAARGSVLEYEISNSGIEFRFELQAGAEKLWENSWKQALTGFEGGVASPSSAFSATLQSEQAFLSRPDEGLGSEFLLIHEILKLHHGSFQAEQDQRKVKLGLRLPLLSSEEALCTVLAARTDSITPELGSLGSIAMALIDVPQSRKLEEFRSDLKARLFRASDAVYALPATRERPQDQIVLILEDCKPEDAPKLLARMQTAAATPLKFGIVTAPADGIDPAKLISLAQSRLREVR